MFRALLCPSSGARDYDVDCHIGRFVLGLLQVGGQVRLGWSSVRAAACSPDTTPELRQRDSVMSYFYCDNTQGSVTTNIAKCTIHCGDFADSRQTCGKRMRIGGQPHTGALIIDEQFNCNTLLIFFLRSQCALPNQCGCRGLLLHLATLNDIQAHTHTHTHT